MVSAGEIVGNMFKENLDSVVFFDIFCCYEKTTHFPNMFLPFSHKGWGILLRISTKPSTKICDRDVATFGLQRCETTKKAAILEQQNMSY